MAVQEAIKRGSATLRARLAQDKVPVRPIYLEDEQKCDEPEKPYRILQPERLAKCSHARDSFLVDRNPFEMTDHFRVHQKTRRDKRCPDDKFRVYRLIHPPPRRYKRCQHHDNIVIDRDSLSTQEHLNILAEPMKRKRPPQVYKLIPKIISPCTFRIKQLALPTKQLVLATWRQHAYHLPVGYIQNFRKTLHTTKFIETAEALEQIRQMKRDERQRRLSRKVETRKLQRKLARKHKREMRDVMRVIFDETKDMFLTGQSPRLVEHMARMSEYVDKNLQTFIDFENYAAAASAPRFVLEKFLQNVADKLVYWAMNFLQAAGVCPEDFPSASTAEVDSFATLFDRPPQEQPYPIDDYIELEHEELLSPEELYPEFEILAEDFTENAESEEVPSETVEEEAEPESPEVPELQPSEPEIEEAEPEVEPTDQVPLESEEVQQHSDEFPEETPPAARRSSQMSDFVRRSIQKLEQDQRNSNISPEDDDQEKQT